MKMPPQIEKQPEQLCQNESRAHGAQAVTMVLPSGAQDRRVADLRTFTEWNSELDRAYDVLGDE